MTLKRMTKISLLTSFLCVSIYLLPPLMIPLVGVEFTLQTAVIILIGLILKPTDAFISVLLYILVGLLGIPVFSGKIGGFQPFLGPTAGFIYMFPIIAYLISLLKSKTKKVFYDLGIIIFVSILITYPIAVIFFTQYTKMPYLKALIYFIPYMSIDLIKVGIAYLVYKKLPEELLEQ